MSTSGAANSEVAPWFSQRNVDGLPDFNLNRQPVSILNYR